LIHKRIHIKDTIFITPILFQDSKGFVNMLLISN